MGERRLMLEEIKESLSALAVEDPLGSTYSTHLALVLVALARRLDELEERL